MRAGAHGLSLLAVPLHIEVLRALADGSRGLADLSRAVGSPPRTTLRGHLGTLVEAGAVERRRENAFPGSVVCELTEPGRELLKVGAVLDHWLKGRPDGRLELGTSAARTAAKALVEGWSSGMLRALAARSLSLTELDRLISQLNYPSLERRLLAMRRAGMVAPSGTSGRVSPYRMTIWGRRAVAPLMASTDWERRHHAAFAASVAQRDIEAALLLTVPLLKLPSRLTGSCRLAVEGRDEECAPRLIGIRIDVRDGKVVSCTSSIEHAGATATGSVPDWLKAALAARPQALTLGGDQNLAVAVLWGLREGLRYLPIPSELPALGNFPRV